MFRPALSADEPAHADAAAGESRIAIDRPAEEPRVDPAEEPRVDPEEPRDARAQGDVTDLPAPQAREAVDDSTTISEVGARDSAAAEASDAPSFASADEAWMDIALHEADRAASLGEVPVGCVLIGPDGAILATAHNQRETLQDPTAHAEMVAIRAAAEKIGSWRLEGVTCVVTLEPCAMCAGALVHARVARVVYGCDDPKGGAVVTLYAIGSDARLNHRFALVRGVRAVECAARLRAFFAALRALGKK